MKGKHMIGCIFLFIVSLVLGACTLQKAKPVTLTLSVAASLTDAMNEIKELYKKENSGVELMLNFGSSGALQQQIEQGAPVDIFISAAPKQMDALQQKNFLMEGSRHDLLENRMVLIVPRDSTAINSFQDLARERVKKVAIGAPESVPAGKYAQEAIVSLGLWEQILPKVVYAKDVRQVLAYVETGNVDAGIVYQTDTKISDKVKVIAAAASQSHSPVLYPMAVIKGSKHSREAVEFTNFLMGEKAKKIFEKYGFIVVAK